MRELNSAAFWKLMGRLDPDPEQAGIKYENLRHKLVVFFEGRSCGHHSDGLADQTLDRVAAKLDEATEIYAHSSLASYCYGVARYVWREWLAGARHEPLEAEAAAAPEANDVEAVRLECLGKCLNSLAPESRKLIMDYYEGERSEKIQNRTRLADYLGITQNAVRRRAHWIRVKQLEPCLKRCEEAGSGK